MAVRAVAAAVVLFRCDDSPRTKPSVDGDFAYVCPAQLASWHTHCSAEGLLSSMHDHEFLQLTSATILAQALREASFNFNCGRHVLMLRYKGHQGNP